MKRCPCAPEPPSAPLNSVSSPPQFPQLPLVLAPTDLDLPWPKHTLAPHPFWEMLQPTRPFHALPLPLPLPMPCPPYMPFLFFEGAQPPSSLSLQAASSMKPANLQAAPARGPPSPWHFPSSLPYPQDSEIRSSQGLRRVHLCMSGGTRDMVGTQLKCLC